MRSTIRVGKSVFGQDVVLADWRYKWHPDGYVIEKEYSSIKAFIQDATDDFTDESYMSDGEWLDVAIDLYDNGIAFL